MKNLQKEYQGLNASFKHFAEHVKLERYNKQTFFQVKLDDELHNIDVDELQKISNSNHQVRKLLYTYL